MICVIANAFYAKKKKILNTSIKSHASRLCIPRVVPKFLNNLKSTTYKQPQNYLRFVSVRLLSLFSLFCPQFWCSIDFKLFNPGIYRRTALVGKKFTKKFSVKRVSSVDENRCAIEFAHPSVDHKITRNLESYFLDLRLCVNSSLINAANFI